MNNTSVTKILLLFYILVGNSLLQPLLSKQWVTAVKDSRIIQHIIGITTMLALAILVSGETEDYTNLILYAFIGYIWFLFSTKMDIHFNVMIMVLLLGNYIYDNHLKNDNKRIFEDKILNEDIKNFLILRNNERSQYVMFSLMALIVCGMFMYSDKKEVQYGGSYSFVNFLLY